MAKQLGKCSFVKHDAAGCLFFGNDRPIGLNRVEIFHLNFKTTIYGEVFVVHHSNEQTFLLFKTRSFKFF